MMILMREDGSSVHLPFDFNFGEMIRGRLSNKAVLSVDARGVRRGKFLSKIVHGTAHSVICLTYQNGFGD
jgi:hypothetical protein